MNSTLLLRHNFKKSLKSAASLIRAIELFSQFLQRVETIGRRGGTPEGTRLLFRIVKGGNDLKFPVPLTLEFACFRIRHGPTIAILADISRAGESRLTRRLHTHSESQQGEGLGAFVGEFVVLVGLQ